MVDDDAEERSHPAVSDFRQRAANYMSSIAKVTDIAFTTGGISLLVSDSHPIKVFNIPVKVFQKI